MSSDRAVAVTGRQRTYGQVWSFTDLRVSAAAAAAARQRAASRSHLVRACDERDQDLDGEPGRAG